MSEAVRIFLARHGETEWNLERRFQGHSDSPLTRRGREQAERLADRLASESLSAVYASDLGRARETAAVVAARHGIEVRPRTELREIDCGSWTGLTWEDLGRRFPDEVERYRTRPTEHRMPHGEDLATVQARAWRFMSALWPEHAGDSILIVTHHIVIETLLARALGLPLEQFWRTLAAGNCSLSVLELDAGSARTVVVYDRSHLDEPTADTPVGERVA